MRLQAFEKYDDLPPLPRIGNIPAHDRKRPVVRRSFWQAAKRTLKVAFVHTAEYCGIKISARF